MGCLDDDRLCAQGHTFKSVREMWGFQLHEVSQPSGMSQGPFSKETHVEVLFWLLVTFYLIRNTWIVIESQSTTVRTCKLCSDTYTSRSHTYKGLRISNSFGRFHVQLHFDTARSSLALTQLMCKICIWCDDHQNAAADHWPLHAFHHQQSWFWKISCDQHLRWHVVMLELLLWVLSNVRPINNCFHSLIKLRDMSL